MLSRIESYNAAMRAASIRRAKGLSQTELAELVGVEQPTISRFENGYDGVTLRLVKQIARALEVEVTDLLGDEREAAEEKLLRAFRMLPRERQLGWLDLAESVAQVVPTTVQ